MKILIADDHAIVRRGMRQLIAEYYPFAKLTEVSDASQLINELKSQDWNLIISDVNMPGRSGLDALQQIKEILPDVPVLIISMYGEEHYALRAIKSGAAGYITKEDLDSTLISAIETVLLGKRYITVEVAEKLANAASQKNSNQQLHDSLSQREFDVMKLLASGLSISEIAEKLMISANTVSTYRGRIFEKMAFKSNADLIKYAIEKNLHF